MDKQQAKELFLDTLRRTSRLRSAAALLEWDMDTIMPPKGLNVRAETAGAISGEIFRLSTADEFGRAVEILKETPAENDAKMARMLEVADRDYTRFKKIPLQEYEAYSVAAAQSSQIWKEAKANNDYDMYAPHLQKMIDFSRSFADKWGYEKHAYDALLEEYDPALLSDQIDPVFAELLAGTKEILSSVPQRQSRPEVPVAEKNQYEIGMYLLKTMGYDLQAGNLYSTEHPFTCTVHSGDVRVTTKYHENQPSSSVFSVMHEGGHGMYEQNISPDLDGSNLMDGTSMGIHESQSRFWENIVGRSLGFWQSNFNEVCRLAGKPLEQNAEEYWKSINHIQPSLIRIEADELTYNLHIIIRYELEKQILNTSISAKELPELWNAKYKEYLGVQPANNNQGIMQDSHWAGGSFGYFPSYAIGNLYAAQFAASMQKELGAVSSLVGSTNGLGSIAHWLKANVQQYGKLKTPEQILKDATGQTLNAKPFLEYMRQKVKSLY